MENTKKESNAASPEQVKKKYCLGYGYLGNGLTVWNSVEERNGDYVTVAHIGPDRAVNFYDKDIPNEVKASIERTARTTALASVFYLKPEAEIIQDDENSIIFIEKESFVTKPFFGGASRQKLIPVYMIKNGVEYFVSNLCVAGGNYSPEYHRDEMEGYKAQLLQTGGRYFKFHGFYDDPEDMLREMTARSHTFVKKDDLFLPSPEGHYGAGHVSFWGNRNEVSAAFHYRILDREYAAKLQELAKPLTGKARKNKNRKGGSNE